MKKKNFILLTGIILIIGAVGNASAQSTNSSFNFSELNDRAAIGTSNLNVISTKAVRDFSNFFKNAINVKWYNPSGGGYVVRFTYNETKMMSAYNKKGHWVYTLSYYDEHKLPKSVRHQVKSTYYDFSISLVIEVKQGNQTIYIIQMEDKYSYLTARVCDGEMEIIKNYIKSK